MCPGFDSQTRRHMWVEFPRIPVSSKTNIKLDLIYLFDLIYLIIIIIIINIINCKQGTLFRKRDKLLLCDSPFP